MSLTPQDIQKQKFNTKFRGFDVDEVDAFLEEVAEDFLALIQENKKLKERIESFEQREAEYQSEEHTFKSAIIAAQKVAVEMKEMARKETTELVTNAREEARVLVAGAREEISRLQEETNSGMDTLKSEIEELEVMKGRIRDELRTTLTRYLNYLEDGLPPEALDVAPAPDATAAGQPAVETASALVAEAAESQEFRRDGSEEAIIEEEATVEEEAIVEEKGLDEAALADMFQETAAAELIEQSRAGSDDDDEDFTDLFQRMEIPDTVDDDGDAEDVIEELTTDLLFSEEPSGKRESGLEERRQIG